VKPKTYRTGGKAPVVTDPKKTVERPKVEKAVVKPKDNNSMTYQPLRVRKVEEVTRNYMGKPIPPSDRATRVWLNDNRGGRGMEPGELSAWLKNPENRLAYGNYQKKVDPLELRQAENKARFNKMGPNPASLPNPIKPIKPKKK
jgi:hypothetical protein